uniref:Protein kinase domain-containing protein n=1 Tax=Zea mays TaxID=4577 RepID=A0A804MY36_MAIZE
MGYATAQTTLQEGVQAIADDQAGCLSRKLGCWSLLYKWDFKDWISLGGLREKDNTNVPNFSEADVMHNLQSFASVMRRRLLSENDNLAALLGNDDKSSDLQNLKEIQRSVDVNSVGSGSFSAFPGIYGQALAPLLPEDIDATTVQQLSTDVTQTTNVEMSGTTYSKWAYIITIPAAILLISLIVLILVLRKRGRAPVAPWKTGLSGPIQKALVTGENLLLVYLILHLGSECLKRLTFCVGNYTEITSLFYFCEALVIEAPRFSLWVQIWPVRELYLCFELHFYIPSSLPLITTSEHPIQVPQCVFCFLCPGAQKLNRAELEVACEDFSNIINTFPTCTVFKGILSSGVEIGVVSTTISSSKDWSRSAESCFKKKIDRLSRVNHKNFINLLGYCLENEPFTRMMVFEFAPHGSLSQHLHVKEFEHLDWAARMRVIMGVAYCLQYMHHELSPPMAIHDVRSDTTFISDDYAAKIADVGVWNELAAKAKAGKEDGSSRAEAPPDLPSNAYCFGALMIETISGRVPDPYDHKPICSWASEHLKDKNYGKLVDASLKEHKESELEAVCEVIQECIDPDPTRRPSMRDVVGKLRDALGISPEAAAPRLSPLWWAELELLSVKST